MRFLVDGQLSPAIAAWINRSYPEHEASSIRSHGLVAAQDPEIFLKANELGAILITKDVDFRDLVVREGSPPQVLLVTCGNTSHARMCAILREHLPTVVKLFAAGEALVQLRD